MFSVFIIFWFFFLSLSLSSHFLHLHTFALFPSLSSTPNHFPLFSLSLCLILSLYIPPFLILKCYCTEKYGLCWSVVHYTLFFIYKYVAFEILCAYLFCVCASQRQLECRSKYKGFGKKITYLTHLTFDTSLKFDIFWREWRQSEGNRVWRK